MKKRSTIDRGELSAKLSRGDPPDGSFFSEGWGGVAGKDGDDPDRPFRMGTDSPIKGGLKRDTCGFEYPGGWGRCWSGVERCNRGAGGMDPGSQQIEGGVERRAKQQSFQIVHPCHRKRSVPVGVKQQVRPAWEVHGSVTSEPGSHADRNRANGAGTTGQHDLLGTGRGTEFGC
eukprot:scaffold116_cov334-Pavlova_lutheri.AAC.15